MVKNIKRLYRSKENRVLGGVCGGIGEYLEVDPVVIRLLWVLLAVLSFGAGILGYLLAWIIIPEKK
jgi:phage shock protein PspC (stress-responsive transcriptional regulator)